MNTLQVTEKEKYRDRNSKAAEELQTFFFLFFCRLEKTSLVLIY